MKQCPNCGFPNLEEVVECISCHERLTPSSVPSSQVGGLAAAANQVPIDDAPRVEPQVSAPPPADMAAAGVTPRDPRASIEALFPVRHGEMPAVAGATTNWDEGGASAQVSHASPTTATTWGQGVSDDSVWLASSESHSVWAAAQPSRTATSLRTKAPEPAFALSDLVSLFGAVLLVLAAFLPWAEGVTADETTASLTAGDIPFTFLVFGNSGSLPIDFLSIALCLAAAAIAVVVGTISGNKPGTATVISTAGLFVLLTAVAFLLRLIFLQSDLEDLQSGLSHAIGPYLCLGAAIIVLFGATLRTKRLNR